MKLIVWGALLAVTLLGGPAAAQSCGSPPGDSEPKNLALGKPTSQSSIYPSGPAEKAVDGKCSGMWTDASCTHTNLEENPWWMVDLGDSHQIYAVVVKNRQDCCDTRLLGAEVHLGDSLEDHGRTNPLCGTILNTSLGCITTIYCNGKQGRYISVHLPRKDYLTICELEAYGPKKGSQHWC